jgi:hypothetical protein
MYLYDAEGIDVTLTHQSFIHIRFVFKNSDVYLFFVKINGSLHVKTGAYLSLSFSNILDTVMQFFLGFLVQHAKFKNKIYLVHYSTNNVKKNGKEPLVIRGMEKKSHLSSEEWKRRATCHQVLKINFILIKVIHSKSLTIC